MRNKQADAALNAKANACSFEGWLQLARQSGDQDTVALVLQLEQTRRLIVESTSEGHRRWLLEMAVWGDRQ